MQKVVLLFVATLTALSWFVAACLTCAGGRDCRSQASSSRLLGLRSPARQNCDHQTPSRARILTVVRTRTAADRPRFPPRGTTRLIWSSEEIHSEQNDAKSCGHVVDRCPDRWRTWFRRNCRRRSGYCQDRLFRSPGSILALAPGRRPSRWIRPPVSDQLGTVRIRANPNGT